MKLTAHDASTISLLIELPSKYLDKIELDQILDDLSPIALEWGKQIVARKRLLAKTHTKVILKWLRKAYKCGGGGYDPTENGGSVIPISEFKLELASRPHVPNKKESKAIRKARKKRGH